MNWNVIKKAVDNGIDSLTDQEYEEYSKIKSSLSPKEWEPIKIAVDNGIDALDDNQYSAYTATKSKIAGSEVANLTPPTQAPAQPQEESLNWSGAVESVFPRLVQQGETDYTAGNVAKNIGLGVLDVATAPGRAIKERIGLGRSEDVGVDPNAGTMTQLGQAILNDPLLMAGGAITRRVGADVGAGLAKTLPSLSNRAVAGAQALASGGAIGFGSNAILSANNEAEFAPIASTALGGLGGLAGQGVGALGGALSRKIGITSDVAQPAITMADKEAFNRLSIPEQIAQAQKMGAQNLGMSEGEYAKLPNELRRMNEAGKFGQAEQAKLNEYMSSITNPENYGKQSVLSTEGDRILESANQKALEKIDAIGGEFNAIESKALVGGDVNIQPIKDHFANVIEKKTGYRPSFDEDGNVVLDKMRKNALPKDTELYRTAKSMSDYVMNLEDMSPQELRGLEIQLKQAYASDYNSANFDDKKQMIAEFVRGKAGDDIGDEDAPKSILGLIREQVAKNPDVTPEEIARYDELRNDYRRSKDVEDWVKNQSGKAFEDPTTGEKSYSKGANFLRRLVSGSQDQNANRLAQWLVDNGGENAKTTADLVHSANALVRSQGAGYDARILHSGSRSAQIPTKSTIIERAVGAVTPEPKTALETITKAHSQKGRVRGADAVARKVKHQPTALGSLGSTLTQKKEIKRGKNESSLSYGLRKAFGIK